ncbi:MAG TPA: MBL fold metallo-hydrolase [Planctomycetota bacterium]|nr:MBL fold metallo-hydrolase [Planctomycetota bacterium]
MKLHFHGAARSVTGSRHLLETRSGGVLLDCGLYQGSRDEAFRRNRLLGFDLKSVQSVVLSHAHIDHSGALPGLVKAGWSGAIYATPATVDLATIMLQDSAYIQERDIEIINRREGTSKEPLYTSDDARAAAAMLRPNPYHQRFQPAEHVVCSFHDAGHILGSSLVQIESEGKRIVFSGDLGRASLPILRNPELLSGADTLLLESTYGNRVHPPEENEERDLQAIIQKVAGRGGKILVPAFAVGRTQHLTYRLKRLERRIPKIPVYVDSPLAADVTEIYRRHPECHAPGTWTNGDPFGFGMLHTVRSPEESKKLNELQGPAIIIAASGMCEHGRILHHLFHHGADERNAILFVGYQAEHTLGRRILEHSETQKTQQIRVHGREMTLRAEVFKMNGLSAHADRPGLQAFVNAHARTLKNAFVVHGEPEAAEDLATWIRETTSARTIVPGLGQEVGL